MTSLIANKFVETYFSKGKIKSVTDLASRGIIFRTANGKRLNILGYIECSLGGYNTPPDLIILVVPIVYDDFCLVETNVLRMLISKHISKKVAYLNQ